MAKMYKPIAQSDFSPPEMPKLVTSLRILCLLTIVCLLIALVSIIFTMAPSSINSRLIESELDQAPFEAFELGSLPICLRRHFLLHYRLIGCRQTIENSTGCSKYFQCNKQIKRSQLNQIVESTTNQYPNHCYSEGKLYQVGEKVAIKGEPCKLCQCSHKRQPGSQTKWKAEVECSQNEPECPEIEHGVKPSPGCYFIYQDDKCCGTQVCPSSHNSFRCHYLSFVYQLGEKINLEDGSCMSCKCDKSWNEKNPSESESCKPIQCSSNAKQKVKEEGCTPIYPRNGCCPIDYVCPKKLINWFNERNQSKLINEEYNASVMDYKLGDGQMNQCWLSGQPTPRGGKIRLKRESTLYENACGSCQCIVPPLLTCRGNYKCQFDKDELPFGELVHANATSS